MNRDVEHMLGSAGFEKLGSLTFELPLEIWWNPQYLIQVSIIPLVPYYLLWATKTYNVVSQGLAGETYSRDLSLLHDWLVSHFPECHMSFSSFRNITPDLALKRINEKRLRGLGEARDISLEEKISKLNDIKETTENIRISVSKAERFLKLADNLKKNSFVNDYLKKNYQENRKTLDELLTEGKKAESEVLVTSRLLKEYQKNGNAVAFLFHFSSNILSAYGQADLQDALLSITKEVLDADRFEIKQKLQGGRLNIFVEPIKHPVLALQIGWAGGAINPKQLAAMGEFEDLRNKVEEHMMVFPSKDIIVNGALKDPKKQLASKALQNWLKRTEKVSSEPLTHVELPKKGGWIGHVMQGEEVTAVPLLSPLKIEHVYMSGTTRAGKSYLGRVLVENALIEGINVVILDPTRQWCGLGKAAEDERVLSRFDEVGIGREYVRGFDVRIYSSESGVGLSLPGDVRSVLSGCSVISLKGLTDAERCRISRDILQAIYDCSTQESDTIRLMIVLEEAHSFLPENVSKEARDLAKEVRNLINRISREKAKYGDVFVFITQSISDFRSDARIVREMVGARFILRATDRIEHEYIETFSSKQSAEAAKRLKEGEAIIDTSSISEVKFYVRAPFSAVREVTDEEILEINSRNQSNYTPVSNDIIRQIYGYQLDEREEKALFLIKEHYEKYGVPMLARDFEKRMNVRGGTRHRLLDQLVEKKQIKTIQMKGKGSPHGLIPLV